MKNKLIATFAASALALGVSAAAQADAHPYAGVGLGYFQGDNDRDLGDAGVFNGTVGYHFNEDWSLEATYGGTNPHLDPSNREFSHTALTAAYRLWSNDSVAVLGLFGAQYTNMDHPNSSIEDNSTQGTVGVALSHYLTDQVELRASVQGGYSDSTEYNDVYTSLGVNYHFGTHGVKEEAPAPVAAAPAPKAEPVVIMKKTLHAHFDNDSSVVKAADKKEIAEVAEAMKNNPGSKADLVGHTDSNASDAYNQKLSEKRAAAVKAELVKQGADADAITASGRGEKEPVADNATATGRAANRRVEATVTGQ